MSHFHAYVAHAAGKPLEPYTYEPKPLGAGQVEIAISHCGVCHSDLHLVKNDWGISRYPLVPGHEIIGTVSAVGSEVRTLQVGQRVGVGWQASSCGQCDFCAIGQEQYCGQQGPTCLIGPGGFASAIRVDAHFAIPIPEALPSREAAPLLCGGITVYSPLRYYRVGAHSRVGVIGIGGLGHFGLQFARALGAEVTAFSSSADKETEAKALGAHHFVATRDGEALRKLRGAFDLILCTAAVELPWGDYLNALRPRGTLCFVAVPGKPVSLNVGMILSGKQVGGSNIGSPGELREMMQVAARHRVLARAEPFPLKDVNTALERVEKNQVRYRAVLEM